MSPGFRKRGGRIEMPDVFMVPLQKEFGWNTADVSSALAERFLLYGPMGPVATALINRFGVRRMVLTALRIVTSGLPLSLLRTQLWPLVVPYCALHSRQRERHVRIT